MNRRRWFTLISIIAIVALSLVLVVRNKTSEPSTNLSLLKQTSASVQSTRLKKHANSAVSIHQVAPSQSPEPSTNQISIPETLPGSCRNKGTILEILNSTADVITDTTQSYSEDIKGCLIELGGPENCFSQTSLEDEDKTCMNNFILARARLIDQMSANRPLDSLDVNVLSNKLMSKIYSTDKSIEQMGPEIFLVADAIIKLDHDNQEANSIRAYAAIPSLREKFDQVVLSKGKESASLLGSFPDERYLKRSLISQYSFAIIDFLVTKDPTNLDLAASYSNDYINKYPNRPEGYHMIATVEGYRDHLQLCKKWTEKGIKVGGDKQPGYADYLAIVSSIDQGSLKKEALGVRFDPSEAFRPDDLLQ